MSSMWARQRRPVGLGDAPSGHALQLTGDGSDYAEIGRAGMAATVTSDAATFEAWIHQPAGATNPQTILLIEGVVPRISVDHHKLGVYWGSGYQSGDASPVTDAKWHHVAVVFDQGTITYFKDGVQLDSNKLPAQQRSGSSLQAGSMIGSTGPFNGLIYDIRVWNVARKPGDIAGSMYATLTGTEPGLVALCTFPNGWIGNQVNKSDGFVSGKAGTAQVIATTLPLPRRSAADIAQSMHQLNESLTEGWDVVSALDARRVNYLFGQQYVTNLAGGQHFPAINDSVTNPGDATSVQFVGVVLGYPLLSFSPTGATANAFINLTAGTIVKQQSPNQLTTVLALQTVMPEDGAELKMLVPMKDTEGTVKNTREVVLDITNVSDEKLQLNIVGPQAQTLLGQHLATLMQQHPEWWHYTLGILNVDDSSVDPNTVTLVPDGHFEIVAQIDQSDPDDFGRVLLFIATKGGSGGGKSNPQLLLDNIVPADGSTALLVSSSLLMRMMQPSYAGQLKPYGATVALNQDDPSNLRTLSRLNVRGGQLNIGPVHKSMPSGLGYTAEWQSGTVSSLGSITPSDVKIPIDGITIRGGGSVVQVTGSPTWSQDWGRIHGKAVLWAGKTLQMKADVNTQQVGTVDAAGNVHLTGVPNIQPGFTDQSAASSFFDDIPLITDYMKQQVERPLEQLFQVQLPTLRTFAVNNLLFPSDNRMLFRSVMAPGDLAVFGDIDTPRLSVDQLEVTLTGGQSFTFTAKIPSGAMDVQWSVPLDASGTIDPVSGQYQAPESVSSTISDLVTVSATVPVDGQLKRQTSLALVYLVPDDMQVSPVYCVMTGNAAAQTFVAAEVGSSDLENLTWSWKPEVGSLTPAGVYTPPAEVDDLQVVIITATSKSGRSGQALVGLLPELPSRIAITPAWVSLSPGQHQQFSAKVVSRAGTAVTWSLLPDVGHIDPKTGAYDPPDSVDRVQPVMVVAKLDADTDVFGVAPILLTPATVGRRSRVGRRQNATPDQHDRKSHGQAIRSDRGHGGGHAG